MARFQFSVGRIFLGIIFVALPFSTFGRMELMGILASLMIAIPMFIASCIATREQFQSMFGIIACTVSVSFIAALFAPAYRRFDEAQYFLFWALVGMFSGILWSESYYRYMAKASLSSTTTESEELPKHDSSFQGSALERNIFEAPPHESQ